MHGIGSRNLSKEQLDEIHLLLSLHSELADANAYNEEYLKQVILRRILELHLSFSDYIKLLKHNTDEVSALAGAFLNSFSEFFRNPLSFSVLEKVILPAIVSNKLRKKNSEIRIWSAACAGGQEAYSLAMIVHEYLNENNIKCRYRIFATDKSEAQLNIARQGNYNSEALNNVTQGRVSRWFTVSSGICSIKPELKNHIDFSVFNLLQSDMVCPPASIFGDFDLVFCANLLFYYKEAYREQILGNASHCISDDGYFVTGETERDILAAAGYSEAYPHSAIFRLPAYAKNN